MDATTDTTTATDELDLVAAALNVDDAPLRIATAYATPEHAHGTAHRTNAEAESDEHHD